MMHALVKGTALVVALAVGLEAGTRIDEWVRWDTPLLSNAQSVSDIIIFDSTGAGGVPGAQYRQFAINSRGFRGPEPRGIGGRVLVLGASETFGLYEHAGREFPRQLEDSLAAQACTVDVYNAGLPGFSLPTLTATYLHRLRGLNASLVVLYPTPVQYLDEARPDFAPPSSPRQPSTRFHLRVVRRLRDHLKVALPQFVQTYLRSRQITTDRARMQQDSIFRTIPDDRLAAFRSDLRSLVDSLRASGTPLLLLTHANAFPPGAPVNDARLIAWTKFYPRASATVLTAFESAANDVIREEAKAAGVPVSDIAAAMAPLDPETAFADFSHFTDTGSATVASTLSSDIRSAIGCPGAAGQRNAPR